MWIKATEDTQELRKAVRWIVLGELTPSIASNDIKISDHVLPGGTQQVSHRGKIQVQVY